MALSDLEIPPELMYRIRFATGSSGGKLPTPIVNRLNSSWNVVTRGIAGEDPHPKPGALADADGNLADPFSLGPNGLG